MLEFSKLALKSLEFVNVILIYLPHINICMHNYCINDVSKRINTVHLDVSRKYCFVCVMHIIMRPLGGAVVRCFLWVF